MLKETWRLLTYPRLPSHCVALYDSNAGDVPTHPATIPTEQSIDLLFN